MLTSILKPVGHGKENRYSAGVAWPKLAAAYTFGNCTAAALTGLMVIVLGRFLTGLRFPLASIATWSCLAIIAVYFPSQIGWSTWPPLLQSTRQVPRSWAYDYQPWGAALLFGLALGSGVYTRMMVPTFYLLLLWSFLIPGSKFILLIWFFYGLTRSLNLWWLAMAAPPGSPFFAAGKINASLAGKADSMYRSNGLVMIAAAVWLLVGIR